MTLTPSAHIDTFTRDSLPAAEDWPVLEFALPELQYPAFLNAAEELLDRTIDRFGAERPALFTSDGASWSYGQLRAAANQCANYLTEVLGVVPGNRVLLRVANSPRAAAWWLGALRAGAVVVTTMPAWTHTELSKVASRVLPRIAIVDEPDATAVAALATLVDPPPVLVTGESPASVWPAVLQQPDTFNAVPTASDDVALLSATSGTTGEPKVTMHFHRDVLSIADSFASKILQLTENDVSASTAPLAFTFGLGALVIFPLRTGGAAVLADNASPLELVSLIEPLGITVLYTAPSGYHTILESGAGKTLGKLRIGVSAGQHLPRSIYEEVLASSGVQLIDGIGATEMLHVFASAAGPDIRPGTTGRAVPGYRLSIRDEHGEELPRDTPGYLSVIGPTGCRYLNDPRQLNYVRQGWNTTGDLYSMDDDGYITYHGRSDSIIVTAGYNVSAFEVEQVLLAHPKVSDCAVIGLPDPAKGAIVGAFIVPRAGVPAGEELTAELLAHLRTVLSLYKSPRHLEYVDALPTNASGKVQKFLLRDRRTPRAEPRTP